MRPCGWAAAVLACLAVCPFPARGDASPDADAAKVSAWATGGASATARPGDGGASSGTSGGIAQATPWPAYVIQGGTIPPDWQPRPIPINVIGPDGRPAVHYYAPTYTFTYQIGPPVGGGQPAAANPWQAAYRQPAASGYAAGPYPPSPYAPSYQPPATSAPAAFTAPGYAASSYAAAPAQAPAFAAAPVPQVPPPVAGNYAPVPGAAPVPVAPPSAPQSWVPSSQPASGWAPAQDASQPPPMAAVAAPVPPIVPVPSGVAAQPVSSSGLAPVAPPASRGANSHLWRVVKVYDGDTVTCLDDMNQQQKVRLAEIDAPEAKQDFGQVSRQALASMVFGKTIEVVDEGRDRYGRWIGRLYTDGIDVNQQMVATGNAWHYAAYSKDPTLTQAQAQAQAQRIGLWSQPNPTPPWEYRKTEKSK